MSRTRRTFTPEFKLQMVRLFENGKSKSEIVREYNLTASALDKWVKIIRTQVHLIILTIYLKKSVNSEDFAKTFNS